MLNGYTSLNITKLDVLTGLSEIKIGVAYRHNGKRLTSMPANLEVLSAVEVEYETFPGYAAFLLICWLLTLPFFSFSWNEDISKCTRFEDLPKQAQNYLKRIEAILKVPIKWIGVGPARESLITL